MRGVRKQKYRSCLETGKAIHYLATFSFVLVLQIFKTGFFLMSWELVLQVRKFILLARVLRCYKYYLS